MLNLFRQSFYGGVIAIAVTCLVNDKAIAQNETDVLRFSQQIPIGTVRIIGLCGAYGALGADLSSISGNPAGIGMYRRSDFGGNLGAFLITVICSSSILILVRAPSISTKTVCGARGMSVGIDLGQDLPPAHTSD